MKVLVLGGTGAMGVHLVKLLANNNIEVSVTTRSYRKSNGMTHYIQGNAHDLNFIQTILVTEWDAIVDFMVYKTEEFEERVDILLKSTSQYIYLSSARVYADSANTITEYSSRLLDISTDKKYLSTDEYALTKARQEDILKNTKYNNWTIVRPYITYSENRFQLGVLEKEDWLYRALRGRTIVFSKDISSKFTTLTYGFDVANGILSIVGNKKTLGEVFHITSDKSYCWNDILAVYLDVLEKKMGKKSKVLIVDKTMNIIYSNKYQVLYDRYYNRHFDNTKISQYINLNNFRDIKEGLSSCLEEFLDNPRFNNIDWKCEALRDKLSGERISFGEIIPLKQKIKYLLYRYVFLYKK